MTQPNKFLALVNARKEREAAETAAAEAAAAVPEFDPSLIPDSPYDLTDEQISLDKFIDGIDILDAHRRWCGKKIIPPKPGQFESIKVSCPNPDHPDVDPSTWVNLRKQTGNCNLCGGYDAHDIYAWNNGFAVPGYKKDGSFPKVRQGMAESFGWTFERTLGGEYYAVPPEPEDDKSDTPDTADTSATPASDESDTPDILPSSLARADMDSTDSDNVEPLYDDADIQTLLLPALDWRTLLPQDTFLRIYMDIACQDDITEEFHFFNALMGLGFALGRDVRLFDSRPVYGNLFVCTLGRTGSGKSQARGYLNQLLLKALKFEYAADYPKGVRRINSPSSAETLIDAFVKDVTDPITKAVIDHAQIKGVIDFNELSLLIGKGARAGNVLKPVMMQFYDMDDEIGTTSRTYKEATAHKPFASCMTTTQPRALRDLITESDDASGFLNRWLFVGGPPKERVAVGGLIADISPAVKPLEDVLGWAASFGPDETVDWEEDALALWSEFFRTRLQPTKHKAEDAGSDLLSRIDLSCKKLILLLTANEMRKTVPAYIVERVIEIYRYLLKCYQVPEEEIGNTLENQITQAIVHQVRRLDNGKGVTVAIIAKALKRRKYPKELILRNLEALVKLGFLTEHRDTTVNRGRPAESARYRYAG